MTAIARRTSASRLHDRLSVDTLPTELTDLANAFNDILARLEDSFRRLSDFSSDLAHEFRTPLSNVMTQTQVALSRSRTAEEYCEVLYSNLEECDRLARTVTDMLFLAKADHGQAMPSVERVDLGREVRELFEFYDALAEDRNVALASSGGGHANAISPPRPGAGVTVSIGDGDTGFVKVRIENPGETIPPEHLPRLFDRFYRVDPARQRSSGGAGLGLAITRSIVTAHGGSIRVSSADGVTVFEMTLPSAGPA